MRVPFTFLLIVLLCMGTLAVAQQPRIPTHDQIRVDFVIVGHETKLHNGDTVFAGNSIEIRILADTNLIGTNTKLYPNQVQLVVAGQAAQNLPGGMTTIRARVPNVGGKNMTLEIGTYSLRDLRTGRVYTITGKRTLTLFVQRWAGGDTNW